MGRWGSTKVGNLFANFRRNKKLTQQDLARDLRISGHYEWLIESGRTLPSFEILMRFCWRVEFNPNVARTYLLDDKMEIYRQKISKQLRMNEVL